MTKFTAPRLQAYQFLCGDKKPHWVVAPNYAEAEKIIRRHVGQELILELYDVRGTYVCTSRKAA